VTYQIVRRRPQESETGSHVRAHALAPPLADEIIVGYNTPMALQLRSRLKQKDELFEILANQ
jgi:hypothetical protein